MPNFHYAKYGKSWGLDVDNDLWDELRPQVATALGVAETSVDYLIQYAVNQTTQDAAAQPTAAAKQSGDDVVAAYIAACDKRWDAIVAGTVGTRSGGGRVTDPFESAVRKLVDAKIAEALKLPANKGKSKPKGAELTALRSRVFDKYKSEIEPAARAMVDALASVKDVEVDIDI